MLSAKQDGNRTESITLKVNSSSGGTVGKVVNSIQGLQQRLNDYSLEEVAAAETRSRSLLLGLLNLESRIGSLVAIKRSMTVVRETVEKTEAEDIKLSVIETSAKPIRLHDIVQASNLIKFPGLKRPSHQIGEAIVPSASSAGQIISNENDTPKSTRDSIGARSYADSRESTDSPNEPAFVFDATEIEAARGIPSADFSWDKDSNPDQNNVDDLRYEPEFRTTAVRSAAEKINQPHPDVSAPEFVQEMLPEQTNTPISTALVPTGGDFDQRLLDDLIKNYGEFFSSSDSAKKVVSEAKNETAEMSKETVLSENATIERAKNNSARTLPLKKEGDIDRELKKIIKDYGEYDIYSRQNRINVKFAVIGGVLLLLALSSGFYFFSSPKSQEAARPPATAEAGSETGNDSSSGKSDLKRSNQATEAKMLNKSPTLKK